MKDEIFVYARYTLIYKQNKSLLFSDKLSGIIVSFMMIILSSYMAMTKIWLWMIFALIVLLMLIYRKKENDLYMKAILTDGLFFVLAAVFIVYLLINSSYINSKYWSIYFLIFLFCFVTYEIFVLINIVRKKYSYKNQKTVSNKKVNNSLIAMLASAGGAMGVILSRLTSLTSDSIPHFVSEMIFILFTTVLLLIGIILAQKYTILKIMKKHG